MMKRCFSVLLAFCLTFQFIFTSAPLSAKELNSLGYLPSEIDISPDSNYSIDSLEEANGMGYLECADYYDPYSGSITFSDSLTANIDEIEENFPVMSSPTPSALLEEQILVPTPTPEPPIQPDYEFEAELEVGRGEMETSMPISLETEQPANAIAAATPTINARDITKVSRQTHEKPQKVTKQKQKGKEKMLQSNREGLIVCKTR